MKIDKPLAIGICRAFFSLIKIAPLIFLSNFKDKLRRKFVKFHKIYR